MVFIRHFNDLLHSQRRFNEVERKDEEFIPFDFHMAHFKFDIFYCYAVQFSCIAIAMNVNFIARYSRTSGFNASL